MTPSGQPCADMQIYPAGETVDREYHRLAPVSTERRQMTEAERLESLRRVACKAGADAVVEAVSEESRAADGSFVTIASGTAVVWTK